MDSSITSHILVPPILVYDALPGTKGLPEYTSCDVLARIGTIHLNKFMQTAGGAENVRCSGNEVMSIVTLSIRCF
jgi:hypothetical protein